MPELPNQLKSDRTFIKKVVHSNQSQPSVIFTYSIINKIMSSDNTHKGFGVIVSSDLHWGPHYQLIIYKIRCWIWWSIS